MKKFSLLIIIIFTHKNYGCANEITSNEITSEDITPCIFFSDYEIETKEQAIQQEQLIKTFRKFIETVHEYTSFSFEEVAKALSLHFDDNENMLLPKSIFNDFNDNDFNSLFLHILILYKTTPSSKDTNLQTALNAIIKIQNKDLEKLKSILHLKNITNADIETAITQLFYKRKTIKKSLSDIDKKEFINSLIGNNNIIQKYSLERLISCLITTLNSHLNQSPADLNLLYNSIDTIIGSNNKIKSFLIHPELLEPLTINFITTSIETLEKLHSNNNLTTKPLNISQWANDVVIICKRNHLTRKTYTQK